MGYGVEVTRGLVGQSKTREGLLRDSHAKKKAEYQHEEQLEETGDVPTEELTKVNLPEEEAEQRLSKESAELESTMKWYVKATSNGERVGDQVYLPFTEHEEVIQQAPKKEAMGPNAFKINNVFDASATKGGQPAEIFMEEEDHTLECA
jgi:hypothetical protein